MDLELTFGRACCPKMVVMSDGQSPSTRFYSDTRFGRTGGQNTIHTSVSIALTQLRDAVSDTLGVAVELVEPMGFEQTMGGGLELHADPVVVVSWQIMGSKRWRFYPAYQIPQDIRALRVALPKEGGGPIVADFYHNTRFTDGAERELLPGDFVVMPAFTLHETHAVADGFSVSATVKLATKEVGHDRPL